MWRIREWLVLFDPRRWAYSWRHAAHVVRVTEAEARGQDFYGSMTLAGEMVARGWLAAPEVAHSGWWGQMEADLAPEALGLDSGPGGCSAFLPGPDPECENGAYNIRAFLTPAPGPDLGRLAWLDRQLDAHAEWAQRMRGQVTGWGLEGAAAA